MILVDANLLLYERPLTSAKAGEAVSAWLADAALAALAIQHGATLDTTDRDLARFPDLRWRDPLASTAG